MIFVILLENNARDHYPNFIFFILFERVMDDSDIIVLDSSEEVSCDENLTFFLCQYLIIFFVTLFTFLFTFLKTAILISL